MAERIDVLYPSKMMPVSDAPARSLTRAPTVTACIATHDRPEYVAACLDSLARQTVGTDGFDILVVDSFGSPATRAALEALVAPVRNAKLLHIARTGASAARNLGARISRADYMAFIDDDAQAAPDWIEALRRVAQEPPRWPAVIGGRVLPRFEVPLPAWWPDSLRGVLSIIEWEGRGEYRSGAVPHGLEPYGVNMAVLRSAMLGLGGFDEDLGRFGGLLLSDEDVQLAWRLQDAGWSARYDSRVVVEHSIQSMRMRPEWLLERLYWQGASTVVTRRLLGGARDVWRELPRRLLVEMVTAPAGLLPTHSTCLMPLRWRLAYARGFTRMALAGERRKRSLPGRALRAALRRDGSPIVPLLDIGPRESEAAVRRAKD